MANTYSGSVVDLNVYQQDVQLADATVSGYVKSIVAKFSVLADEKNNAGDYYKADTWPVTVELSDPSTQKLSDIINYNNLTDTWAQPYINNYLPNITEYLDKLIEQQKRPVVDTVRPPWKG
jgi:hypothetical protein